MEPLREPHEYADRLMRHNIQRRRYERHAILTHHVRIERYRNRHPETSGHPWGWYEVQPLGITVGYWGSSKDDLAGVDIAAWNARAVNPTVNPHA